MNKVGAMIRAFVCVVAASFPLMAIAGPAPDGDNDGIPDVLDNCSALANAGQTCDTDQDGYGNPCDGDFDQSNTVLASDFTGAFLADFGTGTDSGVGTDMDCSGGVLASDFTGPFLTQFGQGAPGPSGLPCAGTVPCN
jgi:hypothetical protein